MFAVVLEFWDFCFIALIVMLFAGGTAAGSTVVRRSRHDDRRLRRLAWRVERLEEKIDLLLSKAGVEYAPTQGKLPEEAAQALREGMVSRAIEIYEHATGVSHEEAKRFVEDVYQRKAF